MFKEAIEKNTYYFVKNQYSSKDGINIDFNFLFHLYAAHMPDLESSIRGDFSPLPTNVLGQVFHIRGFLSEQFKIIVEDLKKRTKDQFSYKNITVDSFFNVKPAAGNVHYDGEHVCIIGTYGTTYYNFPFLNSQVKVEKGDALFIPRKLPHNVLAPGPRIIISVGFHVD